MAAWRSTIEQKAPRLRRRLVNLAKEAFDRIEPGGRGRGVMEDKAGVPVEPGANPGVLVRGVVVEDDVDDLTGGNVGFDRIEKAK